MDQLKNYLVGFLSGARDSLIGIKAIYRLNKKKPREEPKDGQKEGRPNRRRTDSREPNKLIFQCCLLNGGVFMLSMLLFDFVILSWLYKLMEFIFGSESGLVGLVWSWLRPLLSYTFCSLWILPLFMLSRIVNALWFQDIADSAFRGRPQNLRSVANLIADTLFSLVIQALFLIQATLVASIPIPFVGAIVSLCFMSLLYALYSFEYKWFNMGYDLPLRLSYIEKNWPYFMGFGLPLALLTSWSESFFINGCIFSIFFPLFILSGNEARPARASSDIVHLPFFRGVVWLSNRTGIFIMGRGRRL